MHTTMLINGTLVQLDPLRVERRDLVLHEDKLGAPDTQIPTTSTVDCTGCLIVPGLVVAHTHLYSGLAIGMPGPPAPLGAPTTFKEILERIWWRLDQALDEETLRASAHAAALSAIRAGATCVIDHHESPNLIDGALDIIAEALEELGLRALLCYGATDRHGEAGAKAGLAETERFIKKRAQDSLLKGASGIHAPFTVSDETLLGARDIAQRNDAWLHLHAAEGPDDQSAAQARWGNKLLEQLDKNGMLTERTLLAHAVDIDKPQAELIEARGAWVAHQARSNMNNGVGYAGHLGELSRVALGTDGIDNDVLRELQAAFFRSRENTGPAVWRDPVLALAKGQALASKMFDSDLQTFVPQSPADLVVLAYDPPTPLSVESMGAHLIFGMATARVRDVFVAGRPIMRNGRITSADEQKILARTREAASKLWRRIEEI